ncbi:sensor histidine kinase [Micromonosporaceae bacterium Da 78-11]
MAISASLATVIPYLAVPRRYTLGWYAEMVTLLISSVVVLLALLAETASLYRQLSAAHEHLAAVNLKLEAAGRWKSDMIATLTHEINQPLAVISAYSEELTHEWDTTTGDERRTAAQALGKRVNQLLDMAAHLLALCRAEPGDIHTQPIALRARPVSGVRFDIMSSGMEH